MRRIISQILAAAILLVTVFSAVSSTAVSYRLGDVNGDGRITAKDSLLIRKEVAGLSPDIVAEAADINADGEVTLADVLLVRKHLVREITIDSRPITDTYLSDITVFGVSLSEYSIVVPDDADVFETYAAELLQDYVGDKSGIVMPIFKDNESLGEYEFLIGDTNRPESRNAADAQTVSGENYLLKADGNKIVMLGESYMIGAPVGKFTYDFISFDPSLTSQVCDIYELPTSDTLMTYQPIEAKNAILMIGDGMGMNHVSASLYYNTARKVEPDYTEFTAERMPNKAQMTTASLDTFLSGGTTPTDSAAAGTALACGIKTKNHYLGVDPGANARTNIRELAVSLGKRNAVLTTELKEGATPSAFTVHHNERTEYDVIAELQAQITDCDYLKGDAVDELLGETEYALDLISTNNEAGFFAMIEEANIDTYSHLHDQKQLVHCMNRFNKSVQYAMVFAAAHPDTLLIVTADHETGGVNPDCTFSSSSHTTSNVYCYAMGSGSEKITGTVDNIYIPKIIAEQWGVSFPS